MVDEAARRGDDDVGLALEGAQLDGDVLTAVDGNHVDLGHLDGVLRDGFGHLDGKFARGRKDEDGGTAPGKVDARKER